MSEPASTSLFSTGFLRTFVRVVVTALSVSFAAPPAGARGAPLSDGLFARYHWIVERSFDDGSASTFLVCPDARLRLRVKPGATGGRLDYFALFVNGRQITRLDGTGAIGNREGQGVGRETPWVALGASEGLRKGLNKITLVARGRLGAGDRVAPGPAIWGGVVDLLRGRRVNMLVLLKGFAQATGWEAEVYQGLQVLDDDLRAADRTTALDGLDRTLHGAIDRAAEVLEDPETRRFYGEMDDVLYSKTARRMELIPIWKHRVATLRSLTSLLVRSRGLEEAGRLYRRVEGLQAALVAAALARQNLRDLYFLYASREYTRFTADHFKSTLATGRQNLEALDDLQHEIARVRAAVRATVESDRSRGRPVGSEGIESPFGLLTAENRRWVPAEYIDLERLDDVERELNLYLTLIEELVRQDRAMLEAELAFLAELIGEEPPAPSPSRRPLSLRGKHK